VNREMAFVIKNIPPRSFAALEVKTGPLWAGYIRCNLS
jgi:hypothetical protein